MKAILVIDVDDIDIENTQVTYIELECHNYTESMSLINHWLKPLPQKKEVKGDFYKQREIATHQNTLIDFDKGYNKAIDEILGEEE